LIRSVGQKVFVDYYHQFSDLGLSNQEVADLLPHKYTEQARNTRTSCARRIFRDGLEVEALELIGGSTRGGNEGTAKAAQDLLTQMGKTK